MHRRTPFFNTWELAGRFPGILGDEIVGKQASELYRDARAMLRRIVEERWLTANAVFGLWPAQSVGDDVIVGATDTPTTLHFLRQQADKPADRPDLCLADFIAPKESGKPDWIGGFAVTAGIGIEEHIARFEAEHDDYNAIMLKALADHDYAMHLSQCISTKRFVDTFGTIWGYDPFLLAGFPRETLVTADNRAWELLFYIFSPLIGQGRAFKIYPLLFLFLYPPAVYMASRNFGRSRGTALTTAACAIVFFHHSLAIDFFYCGMVSYMLVCFFSFYFLSKAYQLLNSYSWKRYVSLNGIGALMLLCHLLSFMHIIIPCFMLFSLRVRHLPVRQRLYTLAMPIIIAAVNSPWLTVFFRFLHTNLNTSPSSSIKADSPSTNSTSSSPLFLRAQ